MFYVSVMFFQSFRGSAPILFFKRKKGKKESRQTDHTIGQTKRKNDLMGGPSGGEPFIHFFYWWKVGRVDELTWLPFYPFLWKMIFIEFMRIKKSEFSINSDLRDLEGRWRELALDLTYNFLNMGSRKLFYCVARSCGR